MTTTFCHVSAGVVDNRAVFPNGVLPPNWPDALNWVADEVAQIGWTYDGTTFTAPPVPPDPPPTAEQLRIQAFRADQTRANLVTLIQGSTPAQVNSWLATNVTTLPQARAVLAQIILLIGGTSIS